MALYRALALSGLATLALSSGALAQDRNYYCGDGTGEVRVRVLSESRISIRAEFPGSAEGTVTMRMSGGGTPSAGYRFVEGEYSVAFSGRGQDVLHYEAPDFGEIACTWGDDRTGMPEFLFTGSNLPDDDDQEPRKPRGDSAGLPAPGRSCGGKVRSRPDLGSRQVGSLQEGDPITILENVGMMDGYAWFRIRFGSRTGYQWGGILSAANGDVDGAYVGC